MNRLYEIFAESFLDGFSGAGLFGLLERPCAPGEVIDSRSVNEFIASDDWTSQAVLAIRRFSAGDESVQSAGLARLDALGYRMTVSSIFKAQSKETTRTRSSA